MTAATSAANAASELDGRRGTVVLTGATGLIGRHLRPALGDRRVVLLGRRAPTLAANESWLHTDLAEAVRLPALPPGSALCHLAYAREDGPRNLGHTANLLAAVNADPTIDHVVVASTISVYGLGLTGDIDERTQCQPDTEYAHTKLGCERLWFDELRPDCRLTVLRPGVVLSVTGYALATMSRDAVQRPLRGILKKSLLGRNSVHVVPVQNVVSAVAFALDRREGPAREVFLVTNDEAPENDSYAAMQDAIRAICGRAPLPTIPLPRAVQRPVGALFGRPLGVRRTFSSQALRAAGYSDAVRLQDELNAFVQAQIPQPSRGRVQV